MKALFYLGPGKLELREIEKPAGDIVIRVLGAGICGTDLKTYLKGHPMFKPPTILGHECYGRIEATDNYHGSLKVGDTVAVAPYLECGKCDSCKRGVPELCKFKTFVETGCFSEYISMSEEHALRGLFKVEDDPLYSLAEPLACVYNGFEKLGRKPEKLLIVGGGPMGMLLALVGLSEGCETRIVEKSEWRLEYIRRAGIEGSSERPDGTFDSIVLAVNVPELVGEYTPLLADGGSLLLFSGYPKDATISVDPYAVHYREVSITGSFGFGFKHFEKAVGSLSTNRDLFGKLITHRFDMRNAREAFELLNRGRAMKIIFGM